jgi:hypothetical protein
MLWKKPALDGSPANNQTPNRLSAYSLHPQALNGSAFCRVCNAGIDWPPVPEVAPMGIYTNLPNDYVPKGRQTLAGGGAQPNHRTGVRTTVQALQGRQTDSGLAPLQGLCNRWSVPGGYALLHHRLISTAPPAQILCRCQWIASPANVRRPFGTATRTGNWLTQSFIASAW